MERKGYTRDPLDDYQLPESAADKVTFQLMDREQARLDKDYKTADSIREQLEEMGVSIDDKARTWRAGPPPKEKALDLNSAAVTAALTLHPEVWISGFGEASEAQLNEVFRAEFPSITFRMAREKLDDDSDEEDTRFGGTGLESLVMKEAGGGIFDQAGDDNNEPKKVGNGLGYGHVKLESAEEAKNFIYRFDGFPAVGADELKVRVSKQALQGSVGFRSKKMTVHDRRLKALRAEERARIQKEKDGFAAAQRAARASAPVKRVAEPVQRPKTNFQVGLRKRPLPPGNTSENEKGKPLHNDRDSDSDSDSDSSDKTGDGGTALGTLLGGYGGSSSSDSTSDDDNIGSGGEIVKGRGSGDHGIQSSTAKKAKTGATGKEGNNATAIADKASVFKPTVFVPASKPKNTLAVEAMRAKMSGDSKKYAELMEKINHGEGSTQ